MSFLLDTCVLSEGTKEIRDPSVQRWVDAAPPEQLFFSPISLGEIRFGIERLPAGAKRKRLEQWFEELLDTTSAERVLAFDWKTALLWGQLRAGEPNGGFANSQIAATALAHGLTLVTRNVKDFAFPGLAVFNPWSK